MGKVLDPLQDSVAVAFAGSEDGENDGFGRGAGEFARYHEHARVYLDDEGMLRRFAWIIKAYASEFLLREAMRTDLIAVASNPLEDIRQLEAVVFVMKADFVVKERNCALIVSMPLHRLLNSEGTRG